ncbi:MULTISPECIES: PDZ domain-containing protein [unclassified Pseudomonas]|uniref:PDZ domain-containing protein n=1 Tax=unclassified Pseudomonas TaxID=196821 RepID=UPI00249C3BA6|nr:MULTISPECIES: PDZ domain-containing protein [unclassified Pseudomonas]MDI3252185.1 PDZ domain-containing protein [Pseudomonas sp. AL10]MDI3266201.1 PDZ domain-containing protein [Pseudomonas sp. AL15]
MTPRPFNPLALAALFIGLAGCKMAPPLNGYTQYYQSANGFTPEIIAAERSGPPPAVPIIDHATLSTYENVARTWFRRGYAAVGKSEFNSSMPVPEQQALDQAKAIKADLVIIIEPQYQGTTTTTTKVSRPTSSTSVTSVTAGKLNGSATTSTYGTTTDYVPITQKQVAYGALYFVKAHIILGAATIELDEAERQSRQTNYGVKITMVSDDSPAFKADLLIGDTIEKLDGQRISSAAHLSSLINAKKGQVINLSLTRKGKAFEKSIQLNN